jgi:hypothetical protein
LKKYEYNWEKESGRLGAGPRTVSTRKLGMHTLLCPACLKESKEKTGKGWLISVAIFAVLTTIAIAVSIFFAPEPIVHYAMFIGLSAIPFLFVAAYSGLRTRPFMYYIGVKTSPFGVRLILKNPVYAAAFKTVNQTMEVELKPDYTGHKDIFDEGTFMVACCIFGILLPWALPFLLASLG